MIYLDNQATTPLAPEAREAMLRWMGGPDSDSYGNPHSSHRLGRAAQAAVDVAREQVAALFPPGGTTIFTGSATEALNLALRGSDPARAGRPIAVSAIEHSAVLNTAQALENCQVLPVDGEGLVDPQAALPEGLGVLAVMQVNNEIGTVQPVADLAERARGMGALVVCDAVQAAGKMPLADADLIAITGHKLYGPKGIGALWIRDGVGLAPEITGGGQEAGIRSGTLSPALCAGLGAAVKLSLDRMDEDAAHAAALWDRARELLIGWQLNGSAVHRTKCNLNIRREGLDVARLMSDARTVCFSAGSACTSDAKKPSHVLTAIGLSREQAKGSIRLGFGRYTTLAEVEEAACLISAAAEAQF